MQTTVRRVFITRGEKELPVPANLETPDAVGTHLFSEPADFFWQTMTAGAYLPLWSVPCVTSQMEGLLALTPTTLTPFFTLAL